MVLAVADCNDHTAVAHVVAAVAVVDYIQNYNYLATLASNSIAAAVAAIALAASFAMDNYLATLAVVVWDNYSAKPGSSHQLYLHSSFYSVNAAVHTLFYPLFWAKLSFSYSHLGTHCALDMSLSNSVYILSDTIDQMSPHTTFVHYIYKF